MTKATTYRSCSLDTFRQRRLWQRKRRIEKARWGGVNASPAHCVARVVKTAEIVACLSVHRDASLPTGINTRRQESAFPYSIIINLTRWHYSLGCRKMRWRRPKTTNRKKKTRKRRKRVDLFGILHDVTMLCERTLRLSPGNEFWVFIWFLFYTR